MARNVTDAAVLLGAATGVDPDDAATAAQAGNAFTDYTQFLDDEALDGARIGVWRAGTYGPSTAAIVEPILDDTIAALEAEGATVIDPTDIDLSAAANEFAALLCEFKTDIQTYLETYVSGTNPVDGQPYPQTLAELLAFNEAHPDLEGPWDSFLFELGRGDRRPRRRRAPHCARRVTPPIQDEIDEVMAANDLDAIIALTNGPAWITNDDPEGGDTAATDGFANFVGSSTAAAASRLRRHHGAGGLSTACCRSASRSSAARGTSRS